MKRSFATIICIAAATLIADASDFRHIGDFVVRTRLKVSGDKAIPVPIKPMRLSVYTDGLTVRISPEGEPDHASDYTIYRSDGIGQQRKPNGALQVVPGVQATSHKGGTFRQLRLTSNKLTITAFPGVSDQTVITRATLSAAPRAVPVEAAKR